MGQRPEHIWKIVPGDEKEEVGKEESEDLSSR